MSCLLTLRLQTPGTWCTSRDIRSALSARSFKESSVCASRELAWIVGVSILRPKAVAKGRYAAAGGQECCEEVENGVSPRHFLREVCIVDHNGGG